LVRKRKQPSASASQPSEGNTTTAPVVEENEATQAKKQKKVAEPKPQQAQRRIKGVRKGRRRSMKRRKLHLL
jgi:hypothetical protein